MNEFGDGFGRRQCERTIFLGVRAVAYPVPIVEDDAVLVGLVRVPRELVETQQTAVVILQAAVARPEQRASCSEHKIIVLNNRY